MHSRPGRHAKRSGLITDATMWMVGMTLSFLVSFVLHFAAARWLPDLMTNSPDNASKPPGGTSTSTSEATMTPVEQFDNSRSIFPKPVVPIVFRRTASPNAEVSDLPPETEILSPLTTVVDTANTVSTPQLLDLREIEDAKQVQQRLIDLGFLFGAAAGIWGQRSPRAF